MEIVLTGGEPQTGAGIGSIGFALLFDIGRSLKFRPVETGHRVG